MVIPDDHRATTDNSFRLSSNHNSTWEQRIHLKLPPSFTAEMRDRLSPVLSTSYASMHLTLSTHKQVCYPATSVLILYTTLNTSLTIAKHLMDFGLREAKTTKVLSGLKQSLTQRNKQLECKFSVINVQELLKIINKRLFRRL